MKKIILIASLLMAGGLWADADDTVCWVSFSGGLGIPNVMDRIKNECEKGNILRLTMVHNLDLTELISSYCRYDREITIIETDKLPNKTLSELSCVLSNTRWRDYQ